MKIVCSTLPFRNLSVIDALQKMAQLGFRQVELCTDPRHSDSRQWNVLTEKIVQQISRLGVNINSVHVPSTVVPEKIPVNELKKSWTETTLRTIDLAADLKAKFIVQHISCLGGSIQIGLKDESQAEIIPDIRKTVAYAARKEVQLAIENVPTISGRMPGASVGEVMELVKCFPQDLTGICLDVTHCIASGIDPLYALDTIDISRLISIHASDNFYNSFKDQHLPIGRGEIDWAKFFKRLNSYGFKGKLVVEVADKGEDGKPLIESIEYLRNLGII